MQYLDSAYELALDMSRSCYPTYADGLKTRADFDAHAARPFQRDNYTMLLYEEDDEALRLTMNLSLEQVGAALQLGQFGCRMPLLENIVYLGLPVVQRAVFDGSWKEIKKQKIWRNDT